MAGYGHLWMLRGLFVISNLDPVKISSEVSSHNIGS